MKKGSVTIYMSMILAVLLSLFLTVIEGARSRAVSLRADCAFDLSVYSVFGEYNRCLYEEYGLFFIDTAYGETKASPERTNRHLRYYMENNLDKNNSGAKLFDYTKCLVERTEITGCRYATDEKGEVFEQQAVEFMKHRYGISYIEKLQKELERAEDMGLFTRDFSGKREESHAEIQKAEEEGIVVGTDEETGEEIREKIKLDNPADAMNAARKTGILLLVTGSDDVISGQSTDLSESVTRQKPKTKGFGEAEKASVSLTERFWFDAYIAEMSGSYRNPKKTGCLQYQTEYVLAGKDSDADNLKMVAERLLLLREVSNCIYLLSDAEKVAEALTLATSICSVFGPEALVLAEPVKYTLLFAWAYAEAIYDVKQLLAGGEIPLVKSSATWHYSITGMLSSTAEDVSEESLELCAGGLGYEEYLRLFLALEDHSQKVYRMMDIVQMDVRKKSEFENFYLSNCADFLVMEAIVVSRYGYYKELKRKYSYI